MPRYGPSHRVTERQNLYVSFRGSDRDSARERESRAEGSAALCERLGAGDRMGQRRLYERLGARLCE